MEEEAEDLRALKSVLKERMVTSRAKMGISEVD